MSLRSQCLLLILVCSLSGWVAADEPSGKSEKAWFQPITPSSNPFWKRKQKYYDRIVNERAIIVMVRAEKVKGSGSKSINKLQLQGAGLVNAPMDFSYQVARDFNNLAKLSSYIKRTKYDPVRQRLFIYGQAFGFDAQLLLQLQFDQSQESFRDIQFKVVRGVFKGMLGVIRLQDHERRKAEISMTAEYYFDKLAVPQFFVEFGLEVILQKIAARMRSVTEQMFRAQNKSS